MTPPEDLVAIVDAVLVAPALARGKVELAGQPAGITVIGQNAGDQALFGTDALAVGAKAGGMRIAAGEKTSARRRAHRILHEGMGEGDRIVRQFPQMGRADVLVVQAFDGVVALLVGHDPEDVGHALATGFAGGNRPTVGAGLGHLHLLCRAGLERGAPPVIKDCRSCRRFMFRLSSALYYRAGFTETAITAGWRRV